ncbi:MAG: carboxypeptidase-like regulatory domain-containing protein [Clostridium sp.]|nr:carboxypeptidase-like regulatory domain-containing protein [Clostridium sp.]
MKKVKSISKNLLSVVLSLLMIVTTIPFSTVSAAFADESDALNFVITVVDKANSVIEDAIVTIGEDSKMTDENGQADFSILSAADYDVKIEKDGYHPNNVPISISEENLSATVSLSKKINVSGKIVGIDDDEFENLSLNIERIGDLEVPVESVENIALNNDGSFSFVAQEGAVYKATASAKYYVETIQNINVDDTDLDNVNIQLSPKTQKVTATFDGGNGTIKINNEIPGLDNSVSVIVKNGEATLSVEADSDKGYHIKSITGAVTHINNATSNSAINSDVRFEEKFSIEEGKDYTITVTFAINKYDITIESSSYGTVEISTNEVDFGGLVDITVEPKEGYNITALKANSKKLGFNEVTDNDIKYETIITDIKENQAIAVTYEAYEAISLNDAIEISNPVKVDGLKYIFLNDNNAAVIQSKPEEFSGLKVKIKDKIKDKLSGTRNTNSLSYNDTTKITEVDVYNCTAMCWYQVELDNDIEIIIDKTAPEVTLNEYTDAWTNENITISGVVTDQGDSKINKVVYSTEELDVKGVESAKNIIELNENGEFSVEFSEPQEQTYYIYALDYAGNLSEVKEFTVLIDKTEPLITEINFDINKTDLDTEESLAGKFINFFTFGTFSNTDVKVTVKANDANAPSSSGIKEIKLYYTDNDGKKNFVKVEASEYGKDKATETSKGGTYAVYTFILDANTFSKINNLSLISACVTDVAGNRSKLDDHDAAKTNAQTYNLMISYAEPFADIKIATPVDYREKVEIEDETDSKDNGNINTEEITNLWFKNDVLFDITVNDNDNIVNEDNEDETQHCGLKRVEIKINGETVKIDEIEGKEFKTEKKYKISTDIYNETKPIGVQGINTLEVIATNNNGKSNRKPYKQDFYIDTNTPILTGVEVAPSKPTTLWDEVKNLLTFGIFYNDKIDVIVSAEDSVPSSKLNRIELYNGEDLIASKPVTDYAVFDNSRERGYSIFTISTDMSGGEAYVGNLYAVVYDNVGNVLSTTDSVTKTSIADIADDDEVRSNYVVIEKNKPSIQINVEEAHNANGNEATIDGKAWYGDDIDAYVTAEDSDIKSGIRESSISINKDKNSLNSVQYYSDDKAKAADIEKYSIDESDNLITNTENTDIPDDAKYVINAEIVDNAGNSNTTTKTIYIDRYAPEITEFDFGTGDRQDEDGTNFVSEQTYGFYFKKKTVVTITAADTTSSKKVNSGVNTIEYKLVSVDNEIITGSVPVDENNQITVTVPQGFKGQIYAGATDNVGHTGDCVNPSGVVIENIKGVVEFYRTKKTPAKEHTASGQDLYGLSESSVTVPFDATDSDNSTSVSSGIYEVKWEISVPNNLDDYYKQKNRTGYIRFTNKGTIEESKVFDYTGKEITDKKEIDKYISYNWKKDVDDNLIHKVSGKILVENDSNNITVKVTVTDRSGNTNYNTDKFSLDITKPVINITYDDNEKATGNYAQYYNHDRTATVTVTERNFDAERIKALLSNLDFDYQQAPSIETMYTKNEKGKDYWKKTTNKADPNNTVYTYKIKYTTGDGTYDFIISALKDLAGNAFDKSKSTYKDTFIIDKTAANLSVEYTYIDDGKSIGTSPDLYNNKTIRATFTLKDHNADVVAGKSTGTDVKNQKTNNVDIKSSSVVSVTSKDPNAAVTQYPEQLSWKKTDKDTYQATFDMTQMAAYEIKVDGQDMAGNAVIGAVNTPKFVVDTNKPELKLEGIKQVTYAAYNDDVITPVLSIWDNEGNLDESSIKVTINGLSHEKFNLLSDSYTKLSDITNGRKYSTSFFNEDKANLDDIYSMHVEFKDLAGNEFGQDFIFSVNRWGSNYVYDLANTNAKSYDKDNSIVYLTSAIGKVLFSEINCDFLTSEKTQVSLIYTNTEQQKQTQKILNENKDYIISKQPNKEKDMYNMKTYQYKLINENLFELDGEYEVQITTYDAAKNINKNEVANDGTTKTVLRFVVDKNAPRLNLESSFKDYSYEDENHTTITSGNSLKDEIFSNDGKECTLILNIDEKNLGLDAIDINTLKITYDSAEPQTFTSETAAEKNGVYNCEFTLSADDKTITSRHDLVITISDRAGNNNTLTVKDLLVSNNWFVRFLNNTLAVGLTIAALVLVIVGIVVAIIFVKKKKDDDED